jgi:hypothetical protein
MTRARALPIQILSPLLTPSAAHAQTGQSVIKKLFGLECSPQRRTHRVTRFFVIFFLLSTPCFGQSWSNVLSSSRAINWTGAGLPATLPDGETTSNPWTPPTRTQCGATVNPSGLTNGTDVTNINSALAACPAGHFVLLAPGTFYIENANNCYGGSASCIAFFNPATGTTARNGITVRGSGANATILKFSGNSLIAFSVSSSNGSCSWTAGYGVGATSLTTTACSGPALVAGQIATLNQCDSGWSGAGCTTGSSVDDGALYVCKDSGCAQQNLGGSKNQQRQNVLVTSASGSTVTIATPGIYMPNWQLGRTPIISWPSLQTYGDAIEDMTVYAPSGVSATYVLDVGTSYGSWVKGVRFLGSGNNAPLGVQGSKNILVMNNYLFSDIAIDANYPPPVQTDTSSDVLILNNIMASSVPWEGNGGNEGNVIAYNYSRDTFTAYMELIMFDHTGGSAFHLYEGNQLGGLLDDDTWGTHDLNTFHRNYLSGWDSPYANPHPRALAIDDYQRFDNAIGNAIGSQYITTYQSSGDNSAFRFLGGDPLTESTSMRWGNCDTATGACRFQSSEVPTSLSGNAIPFQNSVPGNNNLPCSFFLAGYTSTTCTPHPNGGTGLSWWKVCTSWTTFPTSCARNQTQPFPPIGPDVTGGPFVNGTAYDIPAEVAFKNLPIDPAYQNSYNITGSIWSSGTETLTVSGLPNITHLMGGFQVSAGACAGGEFMMTASTSTTVSYALASNPGSCAGGTMKFPDVRQFDERVYALDGGSGDPVPLPPTNVTATVD